MALSDVTVKVNLVTSVGVEPVWFPLLFVDKSNDPTLATKIPYTECTSLGQLEAIIAAVTEKDTKAEKRQSRRRRVARHCIRRRTPCSCKADTPTGSP